MLRTETQNNARKIVGKEIYIKNGSLRQVLAAIQFRIRVIFFLRIFARRKTHATIMAARVNKVRTYLVVNRQAIECGSSRRNGILSRRSLVHSRMSSMSLRRRRRPTGSRTVKNIPLALDTPWYTIAARVRTEVTAERPRSRDQRAAGGAAWHAHAPIESAAASAAPAILHFRGTSWRRLNLNYTQSMSSRGRGEM